MSRFHNYSFGNILEIARQKPSTTRVARMYAWNQLGHRVKKGEKGIRTLAPIIGINHVINEKLTSFALRFALTGYVDIPRENEFDFLAEAEDAFVPPTPGKKKSKAQQTNDHQNQHQGKPEGRTERRP